MQHENGHRYAEHLGHAVGTLMHMLTRIFFLTLTSTAATANVAQTVTYYITDAQGSITATTDPSGNVTARFDYKPYGSIVSGMPDNGPGYGGHQRDEESALSYMQARYNDSSNGRFLSVDPVSPVPGDIFGFNRYAFASNNPTSNVDPYGMESCENNSSGTAENGGGGPCLPASPTGPSPKDAVPMTGIRVTPVAPRPITRVVPVPAPPVLLAAIVVVASIVIDSNVANEQLTGHASCYGSISCDRPLYMENRSKDFWPADRGAEEWGRRNGVDPDTARRRFHNVKGKDTAHKGGKADWKVDPANGDIIDPEGEVHGNLGDET